MKVAVMGFGHLGKWHCEKALSLLADDFIAIVESFPEAKKNAQEKYPKVKVVDDIKNIINEIDAAIIVTPTSTHYSLVEFLLKNNKHVFCEKPLAVSIDELDKIKPLLKNNLILQVGHIERFQSVWENWKKYFNHSSRFNFHFKRSGVFKGRATDVHVLTDLLIHDLDLLLWLKKEKPVAVKASGFKLRTNFYDEVQAQFYYLDGSCAQFNMSRNYIKEVREIDYTDERGTLQIDLLTQSVFEAPSSQTQPPFVIHHKFEKVDQLQREQSHFYDCIKNNKTPLVGFQEAYEAQFYLDKVLQSLETQKLINL
jgi:predicted dehydrogenase